MAYYLGTIRSDLNNQIPLMELEKRKMDKVRDAWNHYFLEYKFCQDKIAYTEEVATNYFGDIAAYMDDTFPLISTKPFADPNTKHLGNTMALLQAIFVQQDLMDELLAIFRMPISQGEFKSHNRDLRNHLVGHPIRRQKKKLISTVFFRYDDPYSHIVYVLYKTPDFKGEMVRIALDKIINDHKRYLNLNFDAILAKINSILKEQSVHLKNMLAKFSNKDSTVVLIEEMFQYFEEFAEWDFTYRKDRLLGYCQRKSIHPRYANVIHLFRSNLKASLREKIKDIDTYSKKVTVQPPYDPSTFPKIKVQVIKPGSKEARKIQHDEKDIHYPFTKLFERKYHPFGLSYLLEKFGNTKGAIRNELLYMKANTMDEGEYYASYHYLKKLFLAKGYKI